MYRIRPRELGERGPFVYQKLAVAAIVADDNERLAAFGGVFMNILFIIAFIVFILLDPVPIVTPVVHELI